MRACLFSIKRTIKKTAMAIQVTELHNIMPIVNIPSVLTHGILCHEHAAKLPHSDVSMKDIQDRRNKVKVPGGLMLHRYANLYFHARNPMLFKRKDHADQLCILKVSTDVLNIAGAVITDQNASSHYVKFLHPTAINMLQLEQIFADDWRHHDQIAYWRHKSQKCAEVLIPHKISPSLIIGAHVVSQSAQTSLREVGFSQPISITPYLFFR